MSRFKILGVRVSVNERWPRWLCPSYCRWHFRCLKISRCRGWLESGSICRGWFSDFFWEIARPWNKLRVAPFVDTYFLSQQRVSRQCTVSLLKQAWLLVLNGWLRTGKVEHHFMVDILHHLQMGWWNLEIYPWRVANRESAKKIATHQGETHMCRIECDQGCQTTFNWICSFGILTSPF